MTGMAVNINRADRKSKSIPVRAHRGLFDRALIAEGMRRTRTLALIMGILVWTAAALVPVMRGGYGPQTPVLYGPIQINPVLLLCIPVFAPFLTMKAFDFLNSRAGSDLFHSFPVKRQSLAASFLTAVSLWLSVIIGLSILISMASCAVMRSSVTLDTSHLGLWFLQLLAGSLLVEMSVFLTMTVTGTYLTNIVTALGLIFLPRFLIVAAGQMLTEMVPMLSSTHMPLFFSNRLNIVTGLIFGYFLGFVYPSDAGPLYYAPSVVYTLILALIYALIGCVLFVRRPSETAGRPALGEKLQSATRIGIGFLITVPAAMAICTYLADSSRMERSLSDIAVLAALFLGAFGAMFVYEYLSAHRLLPWKALLAGIAAVLLLDAVWIGGGLLMARSYATEHLDKGKIESVEMTSDTYFTAAELFCVNGEFRQEYWGNKLRGVPLADERVRSIVALRHEQTAQETELLDEVEILGNEAAEGESRGWDGYVTLETKIRMADGREIYRNLNYTYDDLTVIWEAAAPVIGDSLLELPEAKELNDIFAQEYYSTDITQIYDSYREELRKLTPEKWIRILSDPASYKEEVIQFYIIRNGTYRMGALPVTKDFPKTRKLMDKTRIQSETESD